MILKRKLRYVLVLASERIDTEMEGKGILNGIMAVVGHLTYHQANPKIAAQCGERLFVIQANRGFEKEIILAFSFVKSVNGRKIGFYTLKVSGMIGKLKEFAETISLD